MLPSWMSRSEPSWKEKNMDLDDLHRRAASAVWVSAKHGSESDATGSSTPKGAHFHVQEEI